jgi:hypothetical protein
MPTSPDPIQPAMARAAIWAGLRLIAIPDRRQPPSMSFTDQAPIDLPHADADAQRYAGRSPSNYGAPAIGQHTSGSNS